MLKVSNGIDTMTVVGRAASTYACQASVLWHYTSLQEEPGQDAAPEAEWARYERMSKLHQFNSKL